MNIKTLNERIAKAEEKVAKKTATIAKKTALIEKKNAQIEKATDENERYWLVCDTNHLREDIIRLENEIKETGATIEKYRKQLAGEIERENTLVREVPETLKRMQAELVEKWDAWDKEDKKRILAAYRELGYKKFFENHSWNELQEARRSDEEIHAANVRDAESAIINLIYRVRDAVGTITDWSGVHVSGGVLNGYVVGTEGRCVVETITAGGWNIQRFHLRVLVKQIH
jgi:chromosome segregation ATPase